MRLAFALVLLAGCTANEGPCSHGECLCDDTSECDYVCADEPCDVTCQSVSDCRGSCFDACTTSCTSVSDCEHACGDTCTVDCSSVSTCTVECGLDCAVSCMDASDCSVRMESGTARCTRVSNCDIRCVAPDGTDVAADDCGGGTFACPSC
jgi:hypothetical protein